MRNIYLATFIMLVGTNFAHAKDTAEPKGAEIIKPFKQQLKQALISGLKQGPANAIGECKLQAPAIATKLSQDGVRVGRSSDRLRNPANTSPDWVAPILASYLKNPSKRTPQTVKISDGQSGYVEPIMVGAMCLTCHGANLSEDLQALLRKNYPKDQATGYQAGDFRGVFWVEYPENHAN